MTTVSAVVPTYNRADRLPEAIESLLRQTRPLDEILIIDDGSTDDTERICKDFPSPVRYIRQENAGVSAARNVAIRRARGEWIAFADSDDTWAPAKLEIQLAALEAAPEADWSITDCVVVDSGGQPLPGVQGFERAFPVFSEFDISGSRHFSRYLERRELRIGGRSEELYVGDPFELLFYGNIVFPSCAVVRKSAFETTGYFDEAFRHAGDTEFFHRLSAGHRVVIVMAPLMNYRSDSSNALTASSNTTRLIRNAITSVDRAAELRTPLSDSQERAYREGKQRLLLRLAYAELSSREGAQARRATAAAWALGAPRSVRSIGIYVASLLPDWCLRGLHRMKRALKGVA